MNAVATREPLAPVKGYLCDDGFVDCVACHVDYPGLTYTPLIAGTWTPYEGYRCDLCGSEIARTGRTRDSRGRIVTACATK